MNLKLLSIGTLATIFIATGCNKKVEEEAPSKRLYVSSGLCYSGGNTTFSASTSSNIVYTVNLSNGSVGEIIRDYNSGTETAGSTPVAIADFDSQYFLVLIENSTTASAKRIEKVSKAGTEKNLYTGDLNILGTGTSPAKALIHDPETHITYISRTRAVEKISSSPGRIPVGATTNSWINAPGGNCGPAALNITSVQALTNGKLLYTHANATQNKVGLISATGYASASDCLLSSPQDAPVAAAFPTASLYIPEYNHYLVVYAGTGTATDVNSVYAYSINEDTNAISGATNAFEDATVLYGASAIARDDSTGAIYIATANSTATTVVNYNIEKFSYDPTTKKLQRVGNIPFSSSWTGSKCISGMFVGY